MEIVMIKLVSGEVVMGRKGEETSQELKIEKPMVLMLDPVQGGIGMMPYDIHFSQKELESLTVNKDHILHTIDYAKDFEDAYIKQTSGIEVAS